MRFLFAFLPAVGLFSCATLIATEVLLHVGADSISTKRARTLHVRILSQEGATRLDRTASLFGDPPDVHLPTVVPVVPSDGDSTRTFTVSAELIDQKNVAFNKKAAVLSFLDHEIVDIDIYFSDLCIGIDCPPGLTCADGDCVDVHAAPLRPTGTRPGDAQPGGCTASLCWEHPRPTGETLTAACLFSPDSGLVLGSSAYVLTNGIWQQESLPPHSDPIDSVACWSGGEAVASAGGSLVERSAMGWKSIALGAAKPLRGVWGLDANEVWVVGDGGEVYRRQNHGSFDKLDPGVASDLRGVWGSSKSDVRIVGSGGTFLRFDGSTFTPSAPPPGADPSLTRIVGSSPTDIAILAGQAVHSYDGKSWMQYSPPGGIFALGGAESGFFVAGGPLRAHFREPGKAWGVASVPYPFDGPFFNTQLPLLGAAVSGSSALLAGTAGALSRWNGVSWGDSSVWLGQRDLRGLASDPVDPKHAVAVGDHGTVLERVGEGIWRRRVVGLGPDVVAPYLAGVWMGQGLEVAVGGGGAIVESTNGKDWSVVPSGTMADLKAVDAAAQRVVAAGSGGVLLERGGSGTWAPFANPFPLSTNLVSLRGRSDGSWIVGADDGSVWQFSTAKTWTKLGSVPVPAPVTEIRIDSSGAIWVAANGLYRLAANAFVAVQPTGLPADGQHFLLAGTNPSWVSDATSSFERQKDGSFTAVGPPVNAMSAAADGRAFLAGGFARILAERR